MNRVHPLESFKYCPRCGSPHFEIEGERSKHCRECGFTYYANASAAVAAIITDSENRVLLTTRAFEPAMGMLDLPGGFVDHDETAEEALHREVHEELGIGIKDVKYMTSRPNIYPFGGVEVHTLDLIYTATMEDGARIEVDDDVAAAQFYELSDVIINKIGLHSIRQVLTEMLQGRGL